MRYQRDYEATTTEAAEKLWEELEERMSEPFREMSSRRLTEDADWIFIELLQDSGVDIDEEELYLLKERNQEKYFAFLEEYRKEYPKVMSKLKEHFYEDNISIWEERALQDVEDQDYDHGGRTIWI